MDKLQELQARYLAPLLARLEAAPPPMVLAVLLGTIVVIQTLFFILLHVFAPQPRQVLPSEKQYITSSATSSNPTSPRPLPCWHDRWLAERRAHEEKEEQEQASGPSPAGEKPSPAPLGAIEPAELRLSVVFPAYNEEDRIVPTLEEAVAWLDSNVGRPGSGKTVAKSKRKDQHHHHRHAHDSKASGYEIIVVNDGSSDRTVKVVLDFAKQKSLHDVVRVVSLERNRGKGGGVTHGMRHVRGEYALFADADGASRFEDVSKLIEGCEEVVDGAHRGVAIGSRAHLVGSEAVVQRSALRNFLMRSFHLVLTILTPPATSRIRDTQCGFKLFTRAALPHIIPYMHTEGWIFDIEMLMLAESAPSVPVLGSDGSVIGESPGIKVAEVPIEWHEVGGSKLNVVQDSIKMAVGLAVLRASWMMGVYRRRLA
ncbi:hypothetical protein N3K66_000452 [Trichothecium roseum]|uniref:Uncharacterized protein n=1 Tax=Trichothecium roseum TaxID=47278 RepID=A0ACC0VEN6_9HYPO|nr:hypothetical protein N3K66_000452 [Trichothecium roseum]